MKEIAVAVDLSKTDESVLKYTKYLANKLNTQKVNLIHVIPSLLSEGNQDVAMHKLLGSGNSLKNRIEAKISETMQPIFTNGLTTEINVLEGNPYRSLLNEADDLDTDLLVVGCKAKTENSGITTSKIARGFKGLVLFVPENISTNITRITVPIDFSDHSARALKTALDLSNQIKNCTVRCVHAINRIPENYYLDMEMKNKVNHQLLSFAKNAWAIFLEKNDLQREQIHIDYLQNIYSSTAHLLNEYFHTQHTDLVVIGAKGHTAFENFLYGSVTENVVHQCSDHAILIVR